MESKIQNLLLSLADESNKSLQDLIKSELSKILNQQEELQTKLKEYEQKITELREATENSEERIMNLQELFSVMEKARDDKLKEIRLRLRSEIRQIVHHIDLNKVWKTEKGKQKFIGRGRVDAFTIHFKNGNYRMIQIDERGNMKIIKEKNESGVWQRYLPRLPLHNKSREEFKNKESHRP